MTALRKPLLRVPASDPLWQKFLAAPVHEGPLPEAEVEGLAEAMRMSTVGGETVTAEIRRRSAVERTTSSRRKG